MISTTANLTALGYQASPGLVKCPRVCNEVLHHPYRELSEETEKYVTPPVHTDPFLAHTKSRLTATVPHSYEAEKVTLT